MTPEEEQALKNIVYRLSARLGELEAEIDRYRINGLQDTFSGSGFWRPAQNIWLNNKGMLLRANNSVDLPALWFVPVLRSDPENSDQYAAVSGDASTSDNYIRLTAKAVPTGVIRLAKLTVYAEGGNAYTENFAAHDALDATRWNGADDIKLTVAEFSTGLSAVYIENAPLKLGTGAADPGTTLQDGMLWYQTTTDKFRARANGATENLATESWVTANAGTSTDYAHSLMTMGA